jgi:hypothetical protein
MLFGRIIMWQDYVMTAGQWIFTVALVPTIRHPRNKPPVSTSLLTIVLLLVYVGTYASLHLLISSLSTLALALAWGIIAVQRFRLDRRL